MKTVLSSLKCNSCMTEGVPPWRCRSDDAIATANRLRITPENLVNATFLRYELWH
jgi:hypothetical protein